MTNKQDLDEEEASRDSNPRAAALMAVHIVGEVLDEAYDIANAAHDSGQPRKYLSMLKKIKNNDIGVVSDEDELFESSKGDSVIENNVEVAANIVTTSTPQKNAPKHLDSSDEGIEFNDSTLIGQGDQDVDQNDITLTNPTSMFINSLFDMSELERVIICGDVNENIQSTSESNDFLSNEAFTKIMENYVNYLFPPNEDKPAYTSSFNPFLSSILPEENIDENVGDPRGEHSEYMFLSNASVADIGRDVGFYIKEDNSADRDGFYRSYETDMDQKNNVFERIRHTTTVEEVYEDLRTDIVYEDYENQQSNALDIQNKKSLPITTEENNVNEDLIYAAIEEDKTLQRETHNNEISKAAKDFSVDEIEISQVTAPEHYRTQNMVISNNNICESQGETTIVETSKDFRAATTVMEVYEGLQTTTDKTKIYESPRTAMIEDVFDSLRIATIDEGLQSATIDKDKTEIRLTAEELKQVEDDIEKEAIKQKNDFELYENAYMTLNRDYDQNSEDDGFPILQDPKEMVLQEVELMTHASEEELKMKNDQPEPKQKEENITTTSGISVRSKSSLARRCRLQGARLFACLRGWWRRKTPGKRKDMRKASLGVCPLSPDARRRSSSLLDSRHLRSPSPSRPVMWKFNTVNEALVNSNRWKEYTFDDATTEGSEQ